MSKCTATAVIAEAKKWIGYLEKKSNADLDSFTGNAGSKNYTCFGRDYAAAMNDKSALPEQWCGEFVSMVFVYAFGLEAAKKLLCGNLYKYTPTGASRFQKQGRYIKRGKGKPQPGDVVFFYSSSKGRIGHTGIVYDVSSSRVYTIEGNTSGGSTLVTNGGCVAKKSYSLSSSYVDGYGRPDYASVDAATDPVTALELGERTLYNGCEGADVKALQEALIGLGFSCGSYGADGEFGDCTEMAVRSFQEVKGLPVTGKYDSATHTAMKAALAAATTPDPDPAELRYVEIVPGKQCYIRAAPNTEGKILGVAHSGDRLPYQGQTFDNGWHLIDYKNMNACVSGKYSKLTK